MLQTKKIIDLKVGYQTLPKSLTIKFTTKFPNPKFSKYTTGFWKNHTIQHALQKMTKIWRSKSNCQHKIGTLIMDLPKNFDTINHTFPLSKSTVSGFKENCFIYKKLLCKLVPVNKI